VSATGPRLSSRDPDDDGFGHAIALTQRRFDLAGKDGAHAGRPLIDAHGQASMTI
jgi:hypothetical protein